MDAFIAACSPWLTAPYAPWPAEQFDEKAFQSVATLAQTRISVLSEITGYVDFLFLSEPVNDEQSWSKAMKSGAEEVLRTAREKLAVAQWHTDDLRTAVESAAGDLGLKLGKAQAPVRVAVTGRTIGLPLFESMEVLGRERTLSRIDAALARLL